MLVKVYVECCWVNLLTYVSTLTFPWEIILCWSIFCKYCTVYLFWLPKTSITDARRILFKIEIAFGTCTVDFTFCLLWPELTTEGSVSYEPLTSESPRGLVKNAGSSMSSPTNSYFYAIACLQRVWKVWSKRHQLHFLSSFGSFVLIHLFIYKHFFF